jgi:acyl-coenzyme A synthetase/AMP-(fatty) acid ligase
MNGAAYVPVDPAFPPDRQSYIFMHSKCQLLITETACFEKAKALGVTLPATIVVDSEGIRLLAKTERNLGGRNFIQQSLGLPSFDNVDAGATLARLRQDAYHRDSGGVCYVLYTSGSTGK